MTIIHKGSIWEGGNNENLDEVIDYLYSIAKKKYEVMGEHGFSRDGVDQFLKIIKHIGYLEQVRASQKKCSKTKKRKESPENS